jgi:hypothetical protein
MKASLFMNQDLGHAVFPIARRAKSHHRNTDSDCVNKPPSSIQGTRNPDLAMHSRKESFCTHMIDDQAEDLKKRLNSADSPDQMVV